MWRAVGAVLAATAGTAFLSGRQLTLFFSQLGGMSWLAVGTASALFGLCCGALCRFARQTGGENVAAVLMRRLDPRTGAAAVAVVESARWVSSPVKFGAACGAGMLAMIAPANAALLRGGEKLTVQAMPTVLLAARRGQPGFVICAGFMALCAVSTLSSLLPGREKR